MLLANADVERPVRHLLHHKFQRRTAGHRRSDPKDLRVLLGKLDDGMTKHILVFGRLWSGVMFLVDLAGDLVEEPGSMPLGLLFLGKGISLPLHGHDM